VATVPPRLLWRGSATERHGLVGGCACEGHLMAQKARGGRLGACRRALRAYVVGSPGLESEVRRAGVEVVWSGRAEAVVVGADERTSYPHIERAARLISDGAIFVATNLDGSFPTPEGPAPAAGVIAAAIEVASGKQPTVIGKPHPSMFKAATESLSAGTRVVMIGDNPETDVLGANRYGIAGVLVSEEAPAFPSERDFRVPDATVPDLLSLLIPRPPPAGGRSPPSRGPTE
jgi:hypothetical protein